MNFIVMSGVLLVFSSEINFRVRKKEKSFVQTKLFISNRHASFSSFFPLCRCIYRRVFADLSKTAEKVGKINAQLVGYLEKPQ